MNQTQQIQVAAESYYDRLQVENEAAADAKEKATEMIVEAFENQTPVPFVQYASSWSNGKLQYEPFDAAVMGLIDCDEVKAALMDLLKSNTPEVKKFIKACEKRHVSDWADVIGGVL